MLPVPHCALQPSFVLGGEDDDHMGHCPHEAISNFNMAGMLDELDKEAGIMAALRHPNVVMFLGVCLEPPCMVAEVCVLLSHACKTMLGI